MQKKPLLSVVMSVFNDMNYVEDAVNSILVQSFSNFEFLIVDDGSTDKTPLILEKFKDPRIILISQSNRGLAASLNRAIEMSCGKYIARMDADDISMPDRFEKQVEFLDKAPDIGLLSCCFYEIDPKSRRIGLCSLPLKDAEIKKGLRVCNQFCHGAAIFRRQCIQSSGKYREFFRFSQDFDLWLRISEKHRCANLADPLYNRRVSPESQSSKSVVSIDDQCLYAAFAIVLSRERQASELDRLEMFPSKKQDIKKEIGMGARINILSEIYFATSRALYKRGAISTARIMAKKACLNNPLQWKNWTNLINPVKNIEK